MESVMGSSATMGRTHHGITEAIILGRAEVEYVQTFALGTAYLRKVRA